MRKAIVIFSVVWFLALGTGSVEYAHNAHHGAEDAHHSHPDEPAPVHDDSNCPVHAQLHQPLIAAPVVVLLISAGLFVAFLTHLAPEPATVRLPARIDCRGPPPCV